MRADTTARRWSWSLLSHHGMVLREIAAGGDITVRELSATIGITERQVSRILRDLQGARMIDVRRTGRRNRYTVLRTARFRHPRLAGVSLQGVLDLLVAHNETREHAHPTRL